MASLIGRVGGGNSTINLTLDLTGYYSKDQADNTFYTKSSAESNFYSKDQVNNGFYTKAIVDSSFYNKAYIDTNKANKSEVEGKANKASPTFTGAVTLDNTSGPSNVLVKTTDPNQMTTLQLQAPGESAQIRIGQLKGLEIMTTTPDSITLSPYLMSAVIVRPDLTTEFKGACTGITAAVGDRSTKLATTNFVGSAITAALAAVPVGAGGSSYFNSNIGNVQSNQGVHIGKSSGNSAQVALVSPAAHIDFVYPSPDNPTVDYTSRIWTSGQGVLEVISPTVTVTAVDDINLDGNVSVLETLTINNQPHMEVNMDTGRAILGGSIWRPVYWDFMSYDVSRGQDPLMWDSLPAVGSETFLVFPLTGVYAINVQLTLGELAYIPGDLYSSHFWEGHCELALGTVNAEEIFYRSRIFHPVAARTVSISLSVTTYIDAGQTWYVFFKTDAVPANKALSIVGDSDRSFITATFIH